MAMRIERWLGTACGISRKQARVLLRDGRIRSGAGCLRPGDQVATTEPLWLDEKPLHWPEDLYLMLHKPCGVVCSHTDPANRVVFDLLDHQGPRHGDLQIVGRLDLDTSGLLLLTTDGQWNHRITSPRSECGKTYEAGLDKPLKPEHMQALMRGVQLRDEPAPARATQCESLPDNQVRLQIVEGRYHQIRRMFAALGYHVETLHRSAIGAVFLDPSLAPGRWRPLSDAEIQMLGTH